MRSAARPFGAHPGTVAPAVTTANPAAWPRSVTTRDGTPYRIRPIRPDDIERDRAFVKRLSPASRYNRMMGSLREPSSAQLDTWVHVDYQREMALVAVTGDEANESIIGVARYAGSPHRCEFAVAVADPWQSHGVGTRLSELLFEYARAHGIRRMYAVLFADNAQMLKLAHDLGMSIRRCAHDTTIVEAWLTL